MRIIFKWPCIICCILWGFFYFPEGFLIIHVPKNQCLYGTKTVTVGYCNLTDPNQQWQWTEDEKLLNLKSGQCLGISRITAPSSRSTMIDCPQAPRWTCHEKENALQVANSSLFLTKQGQKVMVKLGKKYLHSWMQLDVNKEGRPVYRNVCLEKGELLLSGSILEIVKTIPCLVKLLHF